MALSPNARALEVREGSIKIDSSENKSLLLQDLLKNASELMKELKEAEKRIYSLIDNSIQDYPGNLLADLPQSISDRKNSGVKLVDGKGWEHVLPSFSEVRNALNTKVNSVSGKGLSENDFTDGYKETLDGLESGMDSRLNSYRTSLEQDSKDSKFHPISFPKGISVGSEVEVSKNSLPQYVNNGSFFLDASGKALGVMSGYANPQNARIKVVAVTPEINEHPNLLGNYNTHSALPSNADALPPGAKANDYVRVLADETHGNATMEYYVLSIDSEGSVTFGNEIAINTSNYQEQSKSADKGKILTAGETDGLFGIPIDPEEFNDRIAYSFKRIELWAGSLPDLSALSYPEGTMCLIPNVPSPIREVSPSGINSGSCRFYELEGGEWIEIEGEYEPQAMETFWDQISGGFWYLSKAVNGDSWHWHLDEKTTLLWNNSISSNPQSSMPFKSIAYIDFPNESMAKAWSAANPDVLLLGRTESDISHGEGVSKTYDYALPETASSQYGSGVIMTAMFPESGDWSGSFIFQAMGADLPKSLLEFEMSCVGGEFASSLKSLNFKKLPTDKIKFFCKKDDSSRLIKLAVNTFGNTALKIKIADMTQTKNLILAGELSESSTEWKRWSSDYGYARIPVEASNLLTHISEDPKFPGMFFATFVDGTVKPLIPRCFLTSNLVDVSASVKQHFQLTGNGTYDNPYKLELWLHEQLNESTMMLFLDDSVFIPQNSSIEDLKQQAINGHYFKLGWVIETLIKNMAFAKEDYLSKASANLAFQKKLAAGTGIEIENNSVSVIDYDSMRESLANLHQDAHLKGNAIAQLEQDIIHFSEELEALKARDMEHDGEIAVLFEKAQALQSQQSQLTNAVNQCTDKINQAYGEFKFFENETAMAQQQNEFRLTALESGSTGEKIPVPIPGIDGFSEEYLTYSGEPISIIANSEHYSITGWTGSDIPGIALEAGNYGCSLILDDPDHYRWSDGTAAPKQIEFVIKKKEIEPPSLAESEFEYNGAAIEIGNYIASSPHWTVGGQAAEANAGTYTALAALSDKNNHAWSSTHDSEDLEMEWTISRMKIAKPSLIQDSYQFNNCDIAPVLDNPAQLFELTGDFSKRNAGEYAVAVGLSDEGNHEWSDGSSGPFSLAWAIAPKTLENHSFALNGILVFDGTEKTPSFSLSDMDNGYEFDGSEYDLEASPPNPVNAGAYSVLLEFKGNYTGSLSKNFNIAKAVPAPEIPSGMACKVGQLLGSVPIPPDSMGSWHWNDNSVMIDACGFFAAYADYVPSDFANYEELHEVPVELNPAKGIGAGVSKPAEISSTEEEITISSVSMNPGTDQTVIEMYISDDENSGPPQQLIIKDVQTATTFVNLNPGTSYWVYARSQETANYEAGEWSKSNAIATQQYVPPQLVVANTTELAQNILHRVKFASSGNTFQVQPNGFFGNIYLRNKSTSFILLNNNFVNYYGEFYITVNSIDIYEVEMTNCSGPGTYKLNYWS